MGNRSKSFSKNFDHTLAPNGIPARNFRLREFSEKFLDCLVPKLTFWRK